MKHLSFVVDDLMSLERQLGQPQILEYRLKSQSILVQIYSYQNSHSWFRALSSTITESLDNAIVIGGNTLNGIANGNTVNQSTVIGISFFEQSSIKCYSRPCIKGHEIQTGADIANDINSIDISVKGILVVTTPFTVNAVDLLKGFKSKICSSSVFGAGVGDIETTDSVMLVQDQTLESGMLAIAFCGETLELNVFNSLGWLPLSQEMIVTASDGMIVKEINNQPAYAIYERYLGVHSDDRFFLNAIEFPLLIKRNDEYIARVPNQVLNDGSLLFSADIQEGEIVRLAYGDYRTILDNAHNIQNDISKCPPDAIFLYSCICRWHLMGHDVVLETLPYEKIGPTFGFYTAGEISGKQENIEYLNAALVTVALKEGHSKSDLINPSDHTNTVERTDQERHQKRLLTRMTHFISAVSKELTEANQALEKIAITDKLTGLHNRVKIDDAMDTELVRAKRYNDKFSIILFDIDHFKSINDTFGHMIGDQVLIQMAEIIQKHTRESDIKGRWGGEEFLIILPCTVLQEAMNAAEVLRHAIEKKKFSEAGQVTASFGVSEYHAGDLAAILINRADEALYNAKSNGRNQVCSRAL